MPRCVRQRSGWGAGGVGNNAGGAISLRFNYKSIAVSAMRGIMIL